MFRRQNSKEDEINTSNFNLFGDESPKDERKNSNQQSKKKLDNPKSTVVKKKRKINEILNQNSNFFNEMDNQMNNINLNDREDDCNESLNNFRLLQDTLRGEKKSDSNNININIINKDNNIEKNFDEKLRDNENDLNDKSNHKNNFNNIININNNFNNNIININNIGNENKINNDKKIDYNLDNGLDINNNSFNDEEKNKNDNNKIKQSKINENDISIKNNFNQGNKRILNFNKNIRLDPSDNIADKKDFEKLKQNMKLIKNINVNKSNKTFMFSKDKSPLKKKETEEEKRKRLLSEQERNGIRDQLNCYLCFGKINKARLCLNCQKIACENCVKNMLLKHAKCLNCKKPASLDTIVPLPFMDDLTNFFINIENEQNKNQIKEKEQRNFIIDEDEEGENGQNMMQLNHRQIKEEKQNIIKIKCQKHREKYVEYYCFQCKEYLCPKCLLFFNKSSVDKHQGHSIIPITDFKKYNIKEAVDEYNKLNNSYNELDKLLSECQLRIKQLTVKKDITLKNLEETKKQLESNFIEKINLLKNISTTIENKKDSVENSIDSVPNSFSNIISQNDLNQGKLICKELKKLNELFLPLNDIKPKLNSKNNNLYYESFESEEINIVLPENGQYLEELKIYDDEIKLIPEHKSRFKIDLLGGNFIFTLSLDIGNEYYNKYHPIFRGYFILINSNNRCEYANFIGSLYSHGIQILSIELEYDNIKNIIGEKNKCKIICCVDKIYYK